MGDEIHKKILGCKKVRFYRILTPDEITEIKMNITKMSQMTSLIRKYSYSDKHSSSSQFLIALGNVPLQFHTTCGKVKF